MRFDLTPLTESPSEIIMPADFAAAQKKTTPRKKSTAKKPPFDVRAALERAEQGGQIGIPLVAPTEQAGELPAVVYSTAKTPASAIKDGDKQWSALSAYLEKTGETVRIAFGAKRGEGDIVRVRLNDAGRTWLAEERRREIEAAAADRRALEETLKRHADLLAAAHSELTEINRRSGSQLGANSASTDGGWLDTLRRELAQTVDEIVARYAPTDDSAPKLARIEALLTRLAADQSALKDALESRSTANNGRGSAAPPLRPPSPSSLPPVMAATPPADLLAAITACLPESGWLDIPSLRKKLGERGIAIGPGALADELSRHHHSGALRLGAWQQSAREIPHPDHAMLGPNSIVLYYVARKVNQA